MAVMPLIIGTDDRSGTRLWTARCKLCDGRVDNVTCTLAFDWFVDHACTAAPMRDKHVPSARRWQAACEAEPPP